MRTSKIQKENRGPLCQSTTWTANDGNADIRSNNFRNSHCQSGAWMVTNWNADRKCQTPSSRSQGSWEFGKLNLCWWIVLSLTKALNLFCKGVGLEHAGWYGLIGEESITIPQYYTICNPTAICQNSDKQEWLPYICIDNMLRERRKINHNILLIIPKYVTQQVMSKNDYQASASKYAQLIL